MKASIEWLKEYSDVDVTPKELADRLTMTGSKVENIEEKGKEIKKVVVGKIIEIKKHPDADKLIVTKIDIGKEVLQIVTAATNVNVSDIVPVACDGAELVGDIKIKKGMLRGVESAGMMCAVTELGLDVSDFPNQIEDGIMILPESYCEFLGQDIVSVLKMEEDILDFEITSNRPDCLSVEGLGREVAVSLGKVFKAPHKHLNDVKVENMKEIEGLKVDIEAPDLCYRYIARVVKDVKIEPSPEWMQRRLRACGVKVINNIVDITNYVLLEMGQPMHAFDINSIEGKHIIVRRAGKDEIITTLDEEERVLDTDNLVIADSKKPVAIAGIMGGLNSEIEENTTTVVFESAVFNGGNVRLTAKKVGLRTEASSRYEKGLPAELALRVVNRAVELVEEISAGVAVAGMVDVYPAKQEQKEIKLDVDRVNGLLGTNIPKEDMIKILEALEIKVKGDTLTIPYFRQDMENIADVAEEVLRIYGYDKLESTLINAESTIGGKNKKQILEDRIKGLLVDNGYREMYSYGFISEKDLDKCNISKDDTIAKSAIKLKNPLGEDFSIMRPIMIPTTLQSIATNYSRKNKNVKLFEIGRVFADLDGNVEKHELPEERVNIAIATYGDKEDFYTMKNLVDNILEISNIKRYDIEKESNLPYMHPGKAAKILVGKDIIATLGEVHPAVVDNYAIGEKVYFCVLDLEKLTRYGKDNKKYSPIPKYPAVERDIAMIIGEDVEVGQIEKVIGKRAKDILESIELFDIYRNEKLGENKKSVAYSLKFRTMEKTLTDDEVNGMMDAIISDLERELGAELRK